MDRSRTKRSYLTAIESYATSEYAFRTKSYLDQRSRSLTASSVDAVHRPHWVWALLSALGRPLVGLGPDMGMRCQITISRT